MADKRIEVLFLKAKAAERAGDGAAAARLYQRIIEANPGNPRARKALMTLGSPPGEASGGANAGQPGRADLEAIVALYNRGEMDGVGRAAEALLARYPSSVALLSLLGGAQTGLGRHDRAAAAFARAVAASPGDAQGHYNLGTALLAQGRFDDAIACFRRTIAIAPDDAGAHGNLGYALKERGLPEEAIAAFRRAIALRPEDADAHYNLGNILKEQGKLEEAIAAYRQAIARNPGRPEIHNNLGNALREQGLEDAALACFRQAVDIRPDYADGHYNLGCVLIERREPEAAIAALRRALALRPGHAETLAFLGIALSDAARLDEAVAAYEQAIAAAPDYFQPRHSMAHALLLLGAYDQGWPCYEWRWKDPLRADDPTFPEPLWLGGEDIAGKTVFLHHEQGLGDTIQFARYAPLARDRGARVVLGVQEALHPLLRDAFPGIAVIAGSVAPARFDYHVPLASLPLAFGTTPDTIPAPAAYLSADPERVRKWRERIGPEGFRIGICWQGSTARIDRGRSFPVAQFAGIAGLPGVRLISLHKGHGESQLDTLPEGMRVELPGPDFDPEGEAFLDTAAIMRVCDLVITSDTAVAHLAGALGLPVWVMLQHVPDWRWMLGRADSPWYPSMRLFRQQARGDWRSAFAPAETALEALL